MSGSIERIHPGVMLCDQGLASALQFKAYLSLEQGRAASPLATFTDTAAMHCVALRNSQWGIF